MSSEASVDGAIVQPAPHPLAALEESDAYRWYADQRQQYVEQKNKCEEALASDIVKTTSALVVASPPLYVFIGEGAPRDVAIMYLAIGLVLVSLSLSFSLLFRSIAARSYQKLIEELADFYGRKTEVLNAYKHYLVRWLLDGSLALLLAGVVVIGYGMWVELTA
jgi:hypothetical protein